jgi:lipopolysaccharide transport system ATP-binding protein
MPELAIIVDGLSKQYHIGARQNGRKTFREALTEAAAAPFRRLRAFGRSSHRDDNTIWALKDVSFEVQPGEVVGIIGRNGVGKSTLLKILTRITEPTEGRAVLNGRVSSLLEVGTGFHSELTGRENIYLSGAILGMKKREIDGKFGEIVEFSGVEKFIDTPVKRYSSGMTVRLGFAVAAHLEPEILLVDEVLAVGDAEFQKKCLGKMDSVARGGRTVLFVSHNMGAVQKLCSRCVLLRDGAVSYVGGTHHCVESYLDESDSLARSRVSERTDRLGGSSFRFIDCEILDESLTKMTHIEPAAHVRVRVTYECLSPISGVNPGLALFADDGTRLASLAASLLGKLFECKTGLGCFVFDVPKLPLNVGRYHLLLDANRAGETLDRVEDALTFEVSEGAFCATGRLPGRSNPLILDFDMFAEPVNPGG